MNYDTDVKITIVVRMTEDEARDVADALAQALVALRTDVTSKGYTTLRDVRALLLDGLNDVNG